MAAGFANPGGASRSMAMPAITATICLRKRIQLNVRRSGRGPINLT